MIHSFLIVGGTKGKRKLEARDLMLEKKLEARSSKSSLQLQSSVDVMVLEPEEDKQAIGIEQVRDLQHQLSLKPYSSKVKTGIILEAQRLTVEAQNALLKTLEEPPAHSVLVLTAPSVKMLLPTIVSRCQIVRLRSEIDLDFESEEHQQAVEEFLQLLQQGRGDRLAWAEENKTTTNNQQLAIGALDVWISVLRDLLLIQQSRQDLILNSFRSFENLKPPDQKRDESILLCSSIQLAQKTKNLIASTNVSPRLALEVLLLDLPILQE